MRATALLLLVLGVLCCTVALSAADGPLNAAATREMDQRLDQIERGLRVGPNPQTVRGWIQELNQIRSRSADCVSSGNEHMTELGQQLEKLGAPVSDEDGDVTRMRRSLEAEKASLEKVVSGCRLLGVRSDGLLKQTTTLQQTILKTELLAQGENLLELIVKNWRQPGVWVTATQSFLLEHSGIDLLTPTEIVLLIVALLGALFAGHRIRGYLFSAAGRIKLHGQLSAQFSQSLLTVYGHFSPHLLVSCAAALFLLQLTRDMAPTPFIALLAYGLPAYFVLASLIHLFLAPYPPARPFVPLPEDVAKSLGRRLQILLLLSFLGYLLFATLLSQSLPPAALLLARAVFMTAAVLNLIWALWLAEYIPGVAGTRWVRRVLALVLAGAVAAEWLGYRNLSLAMLRASVGTMMLVGLIRLVLRLLHELFEGLEHGQRLWHLRLRGWLGLQRSDPVPGLNWLRPVFMLVVWLAALLVVLRLWGLSDLGAAAWRDYVVGGFQVGSLTVVPSKIALALVTLAVLLSASGWMRTQLERSWLSHTRIERGARESLVTVFGYTGTAVAMLVALAVAGMDFSNLALVAGALSVGIGFGLQNIVNNFISGLILLFERPIKTGDWIVVGSTEGYVRRISIRSTQIQTFDQADVIVPNSELISSQVTNWMLRDPTGRIRVPVGVAYGTDTDLVKKLLLQVAVEHPLVISDGSKPPPRVLFMEFGESSLNFTLFCFLRNIDSRLTTLSDLNFAIDRAFREHNVQIPFPQRDLHVRDWTPASTVDPARAMAKGPEAAQDDYSQESRAP